VRWLQLGSLSSINTVIHARVEVWQGYRIYSLMTGVLTALLIPVFLSETLPFWNGAIQRLMLGILLLWMKVISIKLLRISTAS